ncbi:DUF58 domain-containing protein [Kaarinaea lacus]
MRTTRVSEVEQRRLGDVRSVFRGGGWDYEESRPYQRGDEMRYMDWRLTARSGEPYIKVFREERRPGTFLLVDRRSSMRFGTKVRLKAAQAARITAVKAFRAHKNNAPISGVVINQELIWIEESSSDQGMFELINAALAPCPPYGVATEEPSLCNVLKTLNAMLPRGTTVVLISDFLDLHDSCRSILMRLAMEHEVNAVHVFDSAEQQLPSVGDLSFAPEDASNPIVIDTSNKRVRNEFASKATQHFASVQQLFSNLGIPYTLLPADTDAIEQHIS